MDGNYILDQNFKKRVFLWDDLMYKEFERCTFTGCDFSACDFLSVSFIDCHFNSCNFADAKINYVGFRDAEFFDCNFSGVNFSMVDKLFFGVRFTECILDYAKFYTLKLKGTQFSYCSIVAADFMESDLTETTFDSCNLHKTVFFNTIANKADFSTSYNFSIDPEKNKLKKARFSRSNVHGLLDKYELVIN